ncbi:response regulator [PVC group bacterium]|nr:response regulator [PVC group bacterium]
MDKQEQPTKSSESTKQILLIGEASENTQTIRALLEVAGHTVLHAGSIKAAEIALEQTLFELIVVDCDTGDSVLGSIAEFTSLLSPKTPTVGFTTSRSQTLAISSMRSGAEDLFCLPRDLGVIQDRVEKIIAINHKSELQEKRNEEIRRLYEEAHRAHGIAEEEIESLSHTIASGQCEREQQMRLVAMAAEFRTLVSQELEVESMLRTSLEYLLHRLGPTNAAVFIREGDVGWGVGAYINYDRQGENFTEFLSALGEQACSTVSQDMGLRLFTDGTSFANWIDTEELDFSGNEVISVGCFDGNRCMAVIVFFRNDAKRFGNESVKIVESISPIFGGQLGSILKIHRRAETNWPSESVDDDDWSFGNAA